VSSDQASDLILMARIGAPHGIRGEVRVKGFGDDPLSFADYGPLRTAQGKILEVERARLQKAMAITKFAGVDDRTAAEALNGTDLFVPRDALPALEDADEFYHADLLGLAAVDSDGETLGRIVAVPDFGAGDLLEIAPERGSEKGATFYVPFTREAVPEIDIAGGRVVVVPPADYEDEAGDETEAGAGAHDAAEKGSPDS